MTYDVTPDLDLTQFLGRRVEVKRVSFGQPGRFVGRFDSLRHATLEQMKRSEPDAGGMFRPDRGGKTALALPYGLSSITILD